MRLKNIRLDNRLTLDDMAELLHVTRATYARKENGSIRFSLDEAKIISDYFEMSIEEIFFKPKFVLYKQIKSGVIELTDIKGKKFKIICEEGKFTWEGELNLQKVDS